MPIDIDTAQGYIIASFAREMRATDDYQACLDNQLALVKEAHSDGKIDLASYAMYHECLKILRGYVIIEQLRPRRLDQN